MTDLDLRYHLEAFGSSAFEGYRYEQDLPSARDQQVSEAVSTFLAAPEQDRSPFCAAVDIYSAHTLVSFAERAASWALHSQEIRYVEIGLAAVAWQWQGCEDPCDGIAVMAALYDASERLGVSPTDVFHAAAAHALGDARLAFVDFLARLDLQDICQVMGYSSPSPARGQRYIRSW